MSTIDNTIQTLFAKLEERKAKVASLKSEIAKSWKTNCAYRLVGAAATTNIQTASVEVVEEIATALVMFSEAREKARKRLDRTTTSDMVQGYSVDDWFSDLSKRLASIDIRTEEAQLAQLETRLNQVLSPEERRRIEVELLTRELGE